MSALETEMLEIGRRARIAANTLRLASADQRTAALDAIARRLRAKAPAIAQANEADVATAKGNGLSAALIDRLQLTHERAAALAESVATIAAQPDPIGAITEDWT
ncbi:MAG: gamma-glutamyl-phosphate reductase, partial [Terricaulis sp.]